MNANAELDAMADMTNELDDLGNLFEFGDISLDGIQDPGQYSDHIQQHHETDSGMLFQDVVEPSQLSSVLEQDLGTHGQFELPHNLDQQQLLAQHEKHAPISDSFRPQPIYHSSMQQPYHPYIPQFQYQNHQVLPPNYHVPPTPNSYEMHGEIGQFLKQHHQLDPQQRAFLEQRYHVRTDDATALTPMVSPAGTPQYSLLPEYTTPGAYFSPLTSPMLHAQNHNQQHSNIHYRQQHHGHRREPNTAPGSTTNSPIDPNIDVDMQDGIALPEATGQKGRKHKRKIATPRSTSMIGKTKQSPAQGAQKRRPANANSGLQSAALQSTSANLQPPSKPGSSEAESVSPEPLSESLMGPPPRPGSKNASPALVGQQQHPTALANNHAATPKSILTTRSSHQSDSDQQMSIQDASMAQDELDGLDDLLLPEAATKHRSRKPSLAQIDTQISSASAEESTPRLSSRKTPKLGPLSTPASTRPESALPSPSLAGSPMTASTPSGILNDKRDAKGRRSSKRGSSSANGSKLTSPALVPRISPSIKPLLPEGTPLHSATQAMLLASKSNYQNIVEGTSLPGVQYPDSLHSGLNSKRASHKVAEQGRRNRINDALKEMQSLIPSPTASRIPGSQANGDADGSPEAVEDDRRPDGSIKESKEDAAVRSNSSKAATVELANEYIRNMQKESEANAADLDRLKFENEKLKKRLAEQSGSQTDSPENSMESESTPASAKS